MAIAYASRPLIRIEAHDADHAGGLLQLLVSVFDAEDVSLDGDCFEVEIRPLGDPDAAVLRALDAVDRWLATDGLDSTVVHVLDRSYRIDGPTASGVGR